MSKLTSKSNQTSTPRLRPWEEFARLDIESEEAVREFTQRWNLIVRDEEHPEDPWFLAVEEEEGYLEPIAWRDLKHHHRNFKEAINHLAAFADFVQARTAFSEEDLMGAVGRIKKVEADSLYFDSFLSPRREGVIKDGLPRLVVAFEPRDLDLSPNLIELQERTGRRFLTVGHFYDHLFKDATSGLHILVCSHCGSYFAGSAKQMWHRSRNHMVFCSVCSEQPPHLLVEYKQYKKIYMRTYMPQYKKGIRRKAGRRRRAREEA